MKAWACGRHSGTHSLRSIDKPLDGMQVTVLGFGKIGRGAAQALRAKVISIVHAEIVLSIGELIELNQASRFGIYENTIET